jgi:hypothetical protein
VATAAAEFMNGTINVRPPQQYTQYDVAECVTRTSGNIMSKKQTLQDKPQMLTTAKPDGWGKMLDEREENRHS